jgi:LCP family protein required for cell wall assembly
MAISINQETGDVAMISLPRDLKASPTCTATGKINEVYWCNNMHGDAEEAGAEAIMKEVGGILGIEFQYFAHINWGSLVSIVNTLDGIKVTLDEDISDYGWTGAVFQAGVEYTLNGEQALGLARARHGTTDGDFTRGNSQQKILVGIKDRIYERNISFTDALSLVSSLGDNLRTNLSVSEIKTAIHLTFEFDFNAMRQLPLMDHENNKYYMSYANINGISYVVPSAGVGNYNAIREYVRVNLNNDPVVREQARILILNGSEQVGVAADERDRLRSEEYNVVNIDNIEGDYTADHYIFFTNKDFNGTVESLEKRYNIVAEERFPDGIDATKYDIVIVLGGPKTEVVEE